jgi:hypothetical protein
MAKKPKKEAVKPDEPRGAPAKAKETVVKAVEKVTEVVARAVEAVQEHVVHPVVEAVSKPKKVKKPRFVREKKERRAQSKGSALPPRSTKATAKLMTREIAPPPPKDEKAPSQKPKM